MGSQGWFAPARLPVSRCSSSASGAYRRLAGMPSATGSASSTSRRCSRRCRSASSLYLNFKYGFGHTRRRGSHFDKGEVRERDYFFIVSFSLWGLWAGIGLTALWLRLTERLGGGSKALGRAAPVLSLALLPLMLNWPYASRAGDYAARDWAYNLLNSVEPYGVLFTNGDNDTFPLWYLQEVEGIRRTSR